MNQLRFGQGDLPPELDTLNWSAVFWSGLWALVHGLWSWFAAFAALTAAGLAAYFLASSLVPGARPVLVILTVLHSVAGMVLTIVFAYRANRLLWQRERERLDAWEGASAPLPKKTVGGYLRSQYRWALIGLAVSVIETVQNAWSVLGTELMYTSALVAVELLVLLGLFVFERSRTRAVQRELTSAST